MEEKYRKLLMDDVRQLLDLPEEDFSLIFPKMELKRMKRGRVLKGSGESDVVSRYLVEGFIGAYSLINTKHSLSVIFKTTDTVFDDRSFRTGIPSDSILKCISDVAFYEFTLDSERDVLGRQPRLVTLAHKISLRINERNSTVFELSKKGLENGYEDLMMFFPGLETEITNGDLGDFFRISRRTVERFKHDFKNAKQ
ncbi:CRP-like cAMP-binding protein [Algoriphagus ratkowskyi]|uniref:CRP-like cAMP-binding protein n=1 Tax=Algoriphagus ratkowskyi TaxID=57028 RepID=A0A2W7RXN3_9BACT|nr:hypothetical protein [Algoriphagus ratkowskyi]PZX59349.1 CRP-like cAMP-binding protein [Algoriphagus ratkowskyi]TXD77385.1 hypothetical protein ESW18_11295 [Algoriphagus ratkowskyi]